jgi:hypothetical protein
MKAMALSDAFVQNEEQTFTDQSIEPTDAGTFGKIAADIIPVSWGRFIDAATTTTTATIQEGDSIATVQVVRNISGTFKIMAKQSPEDTALVLIEKPFADQSTRNVIFKASRTDGPILAELTRWRPLVDSRPHPHRSGSQYHPASVHKIGLHTITITDPMFHLRTSGETSRGETADVPR